MSRQTQYPRECCEFIRYVFSLQNQLKISQLTGLPVLKEIYDVMDSFQAGSGNSNILFSQLRNTSFTRPQTPHILSSVSSFPMRFIILPWVLMHKKK